MPRKATGRPPGRPPGRKNNSTLLKEGEIAKALTICEGTAALEAPAIIAAMAMKAKQGDVAAAKLILDRVYPAMRQSDEKQRGEVAIQINIVNSEDPENAIDSKSSTAVTISDLSTLGESPDDTQGGEELAGDGSQEGHKPH